MTSFSAISHVNLEDLTAWVARRAMAEKSMILPFAEFSEVLADLLNVHYQPRSRLITAGLVTPAVAMAAEKAQVELVEQTGDSPFAGDVNSVLEAVTTPHDLIYVANPNRITGANFSLADLEQLARAVPSGLLIVDEYYFDYYGITAFPLLSVLSNVAILRSFTASFSISSSDTGYVIARTDTIERLRQGHRPRHLSLTIRKTILASLINEEAMTTRLQEIHDESLRIAMALSGLGVQCRICATDYLLLRVADCGAVCKKLTRAQVPSENLERYPDLPHYLLYRIQSELSNEKLIAVFGKMPEAEYRMTKLDRRGVQLRSRATRTATPASHNRIMTIESETDLLNRGDKIKESEAETVA